MNFIITEPKVFQKPKPLEYTLSADLQVNIVQHRQNKGLEQLLQQFYKLPSEEFMRRRDLERMLGIALTEAGRKASPQKLQQVVHLLIAGYLANPTQKSRLKLYQIVIVLASLGIDLATVLEHIVKDEERARIYAAILIRSLLQGGFLLLTQLQKGYFCVKSRAGRVSELFRTTFKESDRNILQIAAALKNTSISAQEFRLFLLDTLRDPLRKYLNTTEQHLQKFLHSLVVTDSINTAPQSLSSILHLYEIFDNLDDSFRKCFSTVLTHLVSKHRYSDIPTLHEKITRVLGQCHYDRLVGVYSVHLKAILNTDSLCLQLLDKLSGDAKSFMFIVHNFVAFLEDFAQLQRLTIRVFIKNLLRYPIAQGQQSLPATEIVSGMTEIVGTNYSYRLASFVSEWFKPISQIQVDKTRIVIRCMSKSHYPKKWQELNLVKDIFQNPETLDLLKSFPLVNNILKSLKAEQERLNNSSKSLKSFSVVKHIVQIRLDGVDLSVSLQQLIYILQQIAEKSVCIPLVADFKQRKLINKDSEGNYQINRNQLLSTYDELYPSLNIQAQTKKQEAPKQIPNYVYQGKIIKFMKREKEASFEAIKRVIEIDQALLQLLLTNLEKKDFLNKNNDNYVYVP